MRRFYRLSLALLLLAVNPIYGTSPADSVGRNDSCVKHPLVISPSFGFGELPFLEGPMSGEIYYANEHYKTGSALFNLSVDYLLLQHFNINATVSYQPAPFSSFNIEQYYFYQYISNPYSLNLSPAYEVAADYYRSDNASFGLVASYQSMRGSFGSVQPYFPSAVLFQEYSLGIRSIYYFDGRYSKKVQYYAGGRLEVDLWNETDYWSNVQNNGYIPVIVSSTNGLVLPNNSQFSVTLLGGMRYFFASHIGVQAEAGFGFGSPYYVQAGLVLMLNNGKLKDDNHK